MEELAQEPRAGQVPYYITFGDANQRDKGDEVTSSPLEKEIDATKKRLSAEQA